MTATIACVIAGICATAFITLWFVVTYHKLANQYKEISAAQEQRRLHYDIYRQKRGSTSEQTAKGMLDIDHKIYRDSIYAYNRLYTNPFYRIPGFIMGFRYVKEEKL